MNEVDFVDMEIKIDFARGQGDPTRIFRSMVLLIEAFQEIDQHLAPMFGVSVKTSLLLEDVEASSLKSKLRTVVNSIPDEALKTGEVKKIIGHFLVIAKHKILDWCEERTTIDNYAEVKKLGNDIKNLAQETDIKLLPAYGQIDTPNLLSGIAKIRDAVSPLDANDKATFSSPNRTSKFNPNLIVTDAIIKEIVTKTTLTNKGEKIIKVKKPDYLGSSKWTFKYGNSTIEAKINHHEWLGKFQSGKILLTPGDSLRVTLYEAVMYGFDNEVVHTDYEVLTVHEVVYGPSDDRQLGIYFTGQ